MVEEQGVTARPDGPGSREPSPSVSALTGFDPSRIRPVRQTIFGEDGNCLRAALATVTSRPLESVIDVLDGQAAEHKWWERVQTWGERAGIAIGAVEGAADIADFPPGFSIACGVTRRSPGQTHAVVCLDGAPIFDPHPSNAMLDQIHHYITLAPALAIEARSDETRSGSAVGESAGRQATPIQGTYNGQ